MTTIRRIVTSKIDGNSANSTNDSEIRPFGEAAFYIDNNGPTDKLVLAIHDGVRTHIKSKVLGPGILFGSNADAGDDSGADTIKLIPDATLFDQGSDQYIVVDPTAPNHIHIRAGGTIDDSSAELYLGGEDNNVRVRDSGYVDINVTEGVELNYRDGAGWIGLEDGSAYIKAGTADGLTTAEMTFNAYGVLQVPNTIAGTGGISITPDNTETYAYLNLPSDANSAAYGVALANDNGKIELRTTNQGTSNSYTWKFDNDGTLTLPGSGAVLGWGGTGDTNSLNINIPDSADPDNVTHQFAFDASYGFPILRFPDGTFQSTALKAETIAQVGYRLQFDTDIYANETGGATDANETGVQFASNTVVRELFDLTPPATSTAARAYVDPEATEFQPDPNILEVTIVSGAPISVGMSVYAIVNGTAVLVGYIDSQTNATTFRLLGAPLTEEIPIGTEFEFYGPGNFIEYAPINPMIIEWDSGEETVITAGSTNSPYGVNVFLVTEENQTSLSYPIEVFTDNYAPAEFSHIIDSDNNFKITTKANDFIVDSNEGPLIIRNATSEYIFEGGTLTVPGTINIEGVGSVVGFATGEDNFIGLEGQANWGVALRATDSQLDSKNWLFGVDGNLTLPGELHGAPVMSVGPTPSQVGRTVNITPADDADDKKFRFRIDQYAEQLFTRAYLELPEAEVDKQVAAVFPHANGKAGYIFTQGADTIDDGLNNAFNVFYNAGDIKLTAMTPVTGTFNTWKFGSDGNLTLPDDGVVSAGGSGGLTLGGNFDVKIIADYTDNDRTWSFNGGDGSLTFPDSTVQETAWAGGRVVAVPTSSTGTAGDLQGDLAFNATYMYYCTQNFSGTVINMTSISSSGASNPYIIMYDSNTGWTSADLTGYTVTGPGGYTGTVTGPSVNIAGQLWHIPVSPNLSQSMGTYTFTSPSGNIWKRIAWSGDTW